MTTIPDHDSRSRDDVKSAYHIPTFNGSVVATVPGLKLGDFYRSYCGGERVTVAIHGCAIGGATPPVAATPQPEKPKDSK